MFITRFATPAETLSELLSIPGLNETDTARFKSATHDKHLCPTFQKRVSAMMDAYMSHRSDVHNTQGPRDNGIDVLLVYDYAVETRRVGLQIKSHGEIAKWAAGNDPNFVKTLKAQYAAATQRVDDYYIVLCTDEVVHSRQIRTICSEMAGWARLKIVLPRQALACFEMDDDDVRAFVTRFLCADDGVLKAALATVDTERPYESLMRLACLCRLLLTAQAELTDADLQELYVRATGQQDAQCLPDLLWDPQSLGLEVVNGGDFRIDLSSLPRPLCALFYDSLVRHPRDEDEMLNYLARLLGLH
jgi:hypothetical protein